jgi:pimeloyl-ACP methyl ester carboxylesterase
VNVGVAEGIELSVRVAGAGPGLVLVHGFGGAQDDFADHVAGLAETHKVVTFDHRGHGESGRTDDPAAYSFATFATDALAVADAAGLNQFRLLGHSLGGMIVQEVVLRAPERVERLILMDTSHRCPDGIDASLAQTAAWIATHEGMTSLRDAMLAADPLVTPAAARVTAECPGYAEFGERKWFAQSPVMYAAMVMEIVHQRDRLADLAAIRCPTLVIVGEQDTPFVAQSEAMAATIPDARLVVIPDAGHSPQFENPDAWRKIVDEFLLG